tara:strand:- start:627 stop:995 length:369 start_codon:yes stop_codon:yes gene_type:complete
MEDNKLIAEFMGYGKDEKENIHWIDTEDAYGIASEDLKYHTDWNWLMPVVDKIETIHGVYRRGGLTNGGQMHNAKDTKYIMEYGRYNRCIAHSYAQDRLSAEYNAIVEFIKFYNQNNIRQNG